MPSKPSRFGFTPQEHRISALPSTAASIVVVAVTIFESVRILPSQNLSKSILLVGFGLFWILYLSIFDLFVIPSASFNQRYSWVNAMLTTLSLGILTYATPNQLNIFVGVLLILAAITSSIISERLPSYVMIVLTTSAMIIIRHGFEVFHISVAVISIIVVETVRQLKDLSRNHIRRLEAINEFNRQIASTLETHQVIALLNAAFQNAVEADTYFVGIREGDELRLELIYDDGEYYNNQRVKLDGSLSGWVLENQKSLFLPDLRREAAPPGVRLVLVGRHKTSLSWMGVPMRGESVDGLIAIGSYRPNAFDRADLEMLSALARHAAQALDNTHRHAQAEERARLDSLTGVYNHGHFLKLLQQRADDAAQMHQPLSVIMLDIDYFKQYNDTYGHLAGDEILTNLCGIMKQHIKQSDVVGRWGGEEFVIALPNANSEQARQVAERIRETLSVLTILNQERETIPVPTISQGIAVFPTETDNIIRLIDLADRRLYVAKERGRNQIEPEPNQGELLKMDEVK
jgi:diguanylate cyclase (GGDEF)-like protein